MSRPASREAYFDNVKFIIGFLVFAGHVFTQLKWTREFSALEAVFSSFRMPVFTFLVGYFSQGFLRSKGRARRLIAKVAIVYLIFDLLYQILDAFLGLKGFTFTPLSPYIHLWFLTAMFLWRASAPLWLQMRYPFAVSVFVSLVAGLSELGIFTRPLSMLPFFVLGLMVRREHFETLRRTPVRVAALGILAFQLVVFYLAIPKVFTGRTIFRAIWNRSYERADFPVLFGMSLRLFAIFGTIVVGAAVLSLVSDREGWISRLGSRSLYMYVLHYAFIRVGIAFGLFALFPEGNLGLTLAMVVCFLLGIVLCSKPVYLVFHKLMEPPTDWLFHPRSKAKPKPKPKPPAVPPPAAPPQSEQIHSPLHR
ncbi:acyltransferase family protein [Actinocorallia sp. API 0066]|uniref:acyltransferase family protein n=1 Tax=Actinocorallia sp. API 0066 TaxID=2896846 RepID=UPI001E365AC9|nr:acyltransferase family protein [Actinocorallia sp. API 0066]MCD0451540.1 acyltransferase family protein [Actinocorallia sp. API 0066]